MFDVTSLLYHVWYVRVSDRSLTAVRTCSARPSSGVPVPIEAQVLVLPVHILLIAAVGELETFRTCGVHISMCFCLLMKDEPLSHSVLTSQQQQ